jgi:hypothetical protein
LFILDVPVLVGFVFSLRCLNMKIHVKKTEKPQNGMKGEKKNKGLVD